jgi:hypothetical protein
MPLTITIQPGSSSTTGVVSELGKMRRAEDERGRIMEEIPQAIADIAKRTGTTEDEARLLYCLERTGEAFDALPNVTTGSGFNSPFITKRWST